jgi:hypothetical protein
MIIEFDKPFPEISIYCPGRHDLSLQILYEMKVLSVRHIMQADIEILSRCHGWFWDWTSDSNGCDEEYEHADELGFVINNGETEIVSSDLLKANYQDTRRIMQPIVDAAVRRFRERNQNV